MTTSLTRFDELLNLFPTLQGKPGVSPWDAIELDVWAAGSPSSHAALCAAKFLLMVWDPSTDWECGSFDLKDAMLAWDREHRQAFASWVDDPFWP